MEGNRRGSSRVRPFLAAWWGRSDPVHDEDTLIGPVEQPVARELPQKFLKIVASAHAEDAGRRIPQGEERRVVEKKRFPVRRPVRPELELPHLVHEDAAPLRVKGKPLAIRLVLRHNVALAQGGGEDGGELFHGLVVSQIFRRRAVEGGEEEGEEQERQVDDPLRREPADEERHHAPRQDQHRGEGAQRDPSGRLDRVPGERREQNDPRGEDRRQREGSPASDAPVLPVGPQVEGTPEEDGQRGEQRRRVSDELRVGEGKEKEDEEDPAEEEPPVLRRQVGSSSVPRGANGAAREHQPREETREHDGEEEPERLVMVVDLRREPEEVLPHEEKPEEIRVRPLNEDDPRQGDREEQGEAGEGDRLSDLPVTLRQQHPEQEDRRGEDDPDQPLREKRQGGARVREKQVPSTLPLLRQIEEGGEDRDDHRDGERHVEGVDPPDDVVVEGGAKHHGGEEAGPGTRENRPHPEREEHPRDRNGGGEEPRGELALPEEGEGERVPPVEERGFLEVHHTVQVRGDEVAPDEHLPRDLRVPPLVGLQQGDRSQPGVVDDRDREEEEGDGATAQAASPGCARGGMPGIIPHPRESRTSRSADRGGSGIMAGNILNPNRKRRVSCATTPLRSSLSSPPRDSCFPRSPPPPPRRSLPRRPG